MNNIKTPWFVYLTMIFLATRSVGKRGRDESHCWLGLIYWLDGKRLHIC